MIASSFSRVLKPTFIARSFASATFSLPPLPYAKNALEPIISENTIKCHHDSHHQTYITNLNNLIKGTERKSLDYYIIKEKGAIHNQAAQTWNHSFYWQCMTPSGSNKISACLMDAIKHDFGSLEKLQEAFSKVAVGQFGSGWAWLVHDPHDDVLKVMSTLNGENPMQNGLLPILTCDVWEHAYYLDYQFRRADYVKKWFTLVNWDYVSKVYESGKLPNLDY